MSDKQTFSFNIQVNAGGYSSHYITLAEDKLELLAPAVEDYENNLLVTTTSKFTEQKFLTGPLSLPAAAPMNASFGTRRSYNGQPFNRYHNGADFAGGSGTPNICR